MDNAAFAARIAPMLKPLYYTAYYILRTRSDAEDAVQQGVMKAWAARDRARADMFKTWLTRIVINECRNIQRRWMRETPTEIKVLPLESDPPLDIDLQNAVNGLPDMIRIPFLLKYLTDLTEKETAQALRLPVSTVKNRLARARKCLRDELIDWEVSFNG